MYSASKLTLFFPCLSIIPKVKVWQTIFRVQGRISIEEIGNKGQVQPLVALHNILGADKLFATNLVCLLQHLSGSLSRVVLGGREGGEWLNMALKR